MSERSPFRSITAAEASANIAAVTSAFRCPTGHANPVPVEDLLGEQVAALCPDCDQQLPAGWARTSSALPPFVPDPRLTMRTGA